ncbi:MULTISPECIES: hypothetical protein [Leeuwenhoekiella]|jgi:hypothetical protein|uniref:Uncharacterized protein n=1 Tax=Leeuwenhoekiella blandensis (strain CECT 7118 / CCUG 51940 / KCTC 22103 / MED217) TaxID=398720 RepID=A3XQN2_LEEBM|nr:hypothetical protein [Leeuwenhoekiella blandensis]EAQ48136.1 hypothetical protein MED217_00020 [Leeuwenhoekiella blandensis MED217]HBT10800.1 hypothetical protein [Leeuwenhoekiella sp.]|tara:strand:- start:1403 stop:1792 length:390 start_codon:yes stop_codon:yes gene_type:complete
METQTNNLNTYRILYIIKGIFNLLGAVFFIGYGFFMNFIFTEVNQNAETPFDMSTFFGIICGIGFVMSLIFGIVTLLGAKYIGEARNYTFVLIVAILNCLTGILGILLGIFSIIEINKPHVKALFDQNK